ncbi:glycosyltransferase family 2 protein [Paraburkholderia solisilvae]|uniref:Glycosyltransferase 2-like domain-containing protein n=1 Tax=Paraburkholderia solisilvae TaxID=624376 RepID=A0A6J5F1B3_9BURK|nr:glycosyltransferase [Paraburkholderia solisilvae]CAB3771095.1 hypothetical protein LMG29739_05938 [Paraburkholderia solisilvae]
MQSSTPALPRISVVVLTHDRAGPLVGTLSRLTSLPERPPVIVADNASHDDTVKLVDLLFPQVRLIQCGADLGAAGRNRAVAAVRTDYVAFCDDDCGWEPGSLALAVKLLDGAPQVAVLSARVLSGVGGTTDPACMRMAANAVTARGSPGPALTGFLAGACVFRTAVFRSLGGYERRLCDGGEEALLALDVLNAGHVIAYCDELIVRRSGSAAPDDSAVGAQHAARQRHLARNAAWVAWMRLPWRDVGRATCGALATFVQTHTVWRDGCALAGGLGWALANRHRVNASVLALRAEARAAERCNARLCALAAGDAQQANHTVSEPRPHDH